MWFHSIANDKPSSILENIFMDNHKELSFNVINVLKSGLLIYSLEYPPQEENVTTETMLQA